MTLRRSMISLWLLGAHSRAAEMRHGPHCLLDSHSAPSLIYGTLHDSCMIDV